MHPLIEQYGKEVLRDLMDMAIINEKLDNQKVYDMLLKHKIITRNTKRINCSFRNTNYAFSLALYNSKRYIVDIKIIKSDLPAFIKELNS